MGFAEALGSTEPERVLHQAPSAEIFIYFAFTSIGRSLRIF